jgi:hypothetical protein
MLFERPQPTGSSGGGWLIGPDAIGPAAKGAAETQTSARSSAVAGPSAPMMTRALRISDIARRLTEDVKSMPVTQHIAEVPLS